MLSFDNFIYLIILFFGYLYLSKDYEQFMFLIINNMINFLKFDIQITNQELENLPSKIILVSSHTSIHDFFICYFVHYLYFRKNYTMNVVMKKSFEELTTPVIKLLDNKMKIIQVDTLKKGTTQQIIDYLKDKNNFILAIAPEGTRKCVSELRKGYYFICKELDINVLYIGVDFKKRIIKLESIHKIEDEWEKEKEWFIEKCKKYIPLYPERCYWTREEFLEEIKNIDFNHQIDS